jgi:hypothetical protein
MASVTRSSLSILREWHSPESHPVWFKSFKDSEQEKLVSEDLAASISVAAVLVSVVALGFVLIAGSVVLTLL